MSEGDGSCEVAEILCRICYFDALIVVTGDHEVGVKWGQPGHETCWLRTDIVCGYGCGRG